MRSMHARMVWALLVTLVPLGALGQQMPNAYGPNIGVEAARKAALAAVAEAKRNNWFVAAAVVDTAGALVYFERMDNTQSGSIRVAQEKARASAQFKRPTKAFQDALAGGNHGILGLPGAVPLEGGIPILADNKVIGAIGVSGATSQQDNQCAQAGVDALHKVATK
jgi:glc operon protein GlcG